MQSEILRAAVKLAHTYGYRNVDRATVAESVGIAPSLVSYYYGTMDGLREAIVAHAISSHDWDILAQGIVNREPAVMALDKNIKDQALRYLSDL